jgi:segregation and condensation protein B
LRPGRLSAVAADLQAPLDREKTAEVAAALRETGGRGRPAPIAAAAAAEAVIALNPDAEPLALLYAGAALARALGWPTPLPLLASELFVSRATGEGRRPRPGEAGWMKLVALAYARAALAALDLAQDLSRRAARLADAAPRGSGRDRGAACRRRRFRRGAHRGLERSRAASSVRPPGVLKRRAGAHRPRGVPPLRALDAMARKPNPEPDFDRELADLPPELRWREWKARVEAVLFAAPKPVIREVLARVVGRDCVLELLLDDLKEDLRGRPIELVRAGESFALHTRPAPAVRVAFDIPADAKELTKLKAGVLMAVAMFQPVTRGEISEMFGREISRDLIATLREEGLIAAGPRSPKLGAPYAYVTTEKFLIEFGFESLRDLPDLEALKDAGLMPGGGQPGDRDGETEAEEGARPFTATSGFARSRIVEHDLAKVGFEGSKSTAYARWNR